MSEAVKEQGFIITTPTFRVSFPKVFKAVRNELNGKDEFSVQALFEIKKDDPAFEKMKIAANAAMIKKFGADKSSWPAKIRSPFRDQAERAKGDALPDGHVAGHVLMTFKSETRPGVIDRDGSTLITDPSRFYAGCFARALVFASAYKQMGNSGVSFYLNHLQFVKDGPPLSGRPTIEGAFAPIEGDSGEGTPKTAADMF